MVIQINGRIKEGIVIPELRVPWYGTCKMSTPILKDREPVDQKIGFQSEDELMATAKKIVINKVEISNTYRMSKNKTDMNGRKSNG